MLPLALPFFINPILFLSYLIINEWNVVSNEVSQHNHCTLYDRSDDNENYLEVNLDNVPFFLKMVTRSMYSIPVVFGSQGTFLPPIKPVVLSLTWSMSTNSFKASMHMDMSGMLHHLFALYSGHGAIPLFLGPSKMSLWSFNLMHVSSFLSSYWYII